MSEIRIDRTSCLLCGACVGTCPAAALTVHVTFVQWDPERCTHCGWCVKACPTASITQGEGA